MKRLENQAKYVCPCCGYPWLDMPPYANAPRPPYPPGITPPYRESLGEASYDVCPCCAFEYGLEDEPSGSVPGDTFEAYLGKWIADGCPWFEEVKKPEGWSLDEQLRAVGLEQRLSNKQDDQNSS